MKKIISICAVVLAVAMLVTAFTACGKKTEPETTTEPSKTPVVVKGYQAIVGKEDIVVKKDGKDFQKLSYPEQLDADFDIEYAKEHNEFIDVNFDGAVDFYVATSNNEETIKYCFYLFNSESKKFEYSESMSKLSNVVIDSDNNLVLSLVGTGDDSKVEAYEWVDGDIKSADDKLDGTVDLGTVTFLGQHKPIENTSEVTTTLENKDNNDDSKEPVEESTKEPAKKPAKNPAKKPAKKPAKETEPIKNETTQASGGVVLGTGDFNEGWF